MTTTDIISAARRILQDTESPYHWSDDNLKNNLKFAIQGLHKVRPETRYVNGLLVDCVTLPASASDTISIDERFKDALVYYVGYMAYMDDCTDPVSKALGDDFLGKFNMFAQI